MIDIAKHQTLKITSEANSDLKLEGFINTISSEIQLDENQAANVYMAVNEAVKNAILFGNRENPNKQVIIIVDKVDSTLSFTIKDEGTGFDFNNLPDPTAPENIENVTGRGIFLMKSLADSVEFKDNGSTVVLKFNY
jgi:serine/threonine-protein kinase RsbW